MKLGAPWIRAMIAAIVSTIWCQSLKEVAMTIQSSPMDSSGSPTQVWARLATDLQERAIHLMAQLAFNLVAAQSDGRPLQESDHVIPSHAPQNPA